MPSCFLIYWSRIQMIGLVHNTYKPYTLVGPTVTRPVQDPLALLRLENKLFMSFYTIPQTKTFRCKITFWLYLTNGDFVPITLIWR